MGFAVVVDTTADLNPEEYADLDVFYVPLNIEVGGETFKDQAEISSEEFYERMLASDTLPKSGQPSPLDFKELYERFADEGYDAVIALHIAPALSGTIQSSQLAADKVDIPVYVIDSCTACAGLGLLAKQAAAMRDAGMAAEDAVKALEDLKMKTTFFLACDTLDNLLAGGRMSAEQVDQATLLNIKPVMFIDTDGVLKVMDKAKGMNGVVKKFVEQIKDRTEKYGKEIVRFASAGNPEAVEKLKHALEKDGVDYVDGGTCLCGATVATHTGVRALGVATMPYMED